ncbi:Protein of unknown function [Gryllus bimaculatus]|nr:Protein of unknown function [Gryllus bimaculatus]
MYVPKRSDKTEPIERGCRRRGGLSASCVPPVLAPPPPATQGQSEAPIRQAAVNRKETNCCRCVRQFKRRTGSTARSSFPEVSQRQPSSEAMRGPDGKLGSAVGAVGSVWEKSGVSVRDIEVFRYWL